MSSRPRPVWLEERLRRQYSAAAIERAGHDGGARFYLKQWRVAEAMTGADERDAHGCPSCGEFSGRHWIGCPVHVYNVLTRSPVSSQPKPRATEKPTLFVLSI